MTSIVSGATWMCSATMGYPFFGKSEWYALSMAFDTVAFSTTRRFTKMVWRSRLDFKSDGFEMSPSTSAVSVSSRTSSISPETSTP